MKYLQAIEIVLFIIVLLESPQALVDGVLAIIALIFHILLSEGLNIILDQTRHVVNQLELFVR